MSLLIESIKKGTVMTIRLGLMDFENNFLLPSLSPEALRSELRNSKSVTPRNHYANMLELKPE